MFTKCQEEFLEWFTACLAIICFLAIIALWIYIYSKYDLSVDDKINLVEKMRPLCEMQGKSTMFDEKENEAYCYIKWDEYKIWK